MPLPEQREDDRSDAPKPVAKRPIGTGLSPTVERMFGALLDEGDTAGADSSPESETRRGRRPGAA